MGFICLSGRCHVPAFGFGGPRRVFASLLKGFLILLGEDRGGGRIKA